MIKSKEIRLVALDDIKLNPNNINKHPEDQIDRLAEIIKYQGFRVPVIISNQSGILIAGEGRYLAAKKLGLSEIPAIFQDFDSEEQEYAFGVSDNSISSWAKLDIQKINLDLPDLGPDFNVDLLGIKNFIVEPLEKLNITKEDDTKKYIIEVQFKNEVDMIDIHNDLVRRGYEVKIKNK